MYSSYVTLVVAGLKLANLILGWVHDRQQFTAGQQDAIATAAAALLARTQWAKKIQEKVDAKDAAGVDELLTSLGVSDGK